MYGQLNSIDLPWAGAIYQRLASNAKNDLMHLTHQRFPHLTQIVRRPSIEAGIRFYRGIQCEFLCKM
jgi:hypothetical protein